MRSKRIMSLAMAAALTLAGGLVGTAPATAAPGKLDAASVGKNKHSNSVYIVMMADNPVVAYDGKIKGYPATRPGKGKKIDANSPAVKKYAARLGAQHESLTSSIGAQQVYSYRYSFNGFAAKMTAAEAAALRARSDVLMVWKDELQKLHTNTSPTYIGLTEGSDPWSKGYAGEDVVVGVIDTGIWPEHPSFADVPTPKKGNKGPMIPFGPPPASWTGDGTCDFGNVADPGDAPFECNNKILTARYYIDSFGAGNIASTEFLSARDSDNHGSHTASTAAGDYGVEASINGTALGTISGMAPRARLAIYKACWAAPDPDDDGCYSSDTAAAVDQAVADGVDVINYSIGGSSTYFATPTNVAFLFAADAGVFVATSNGNTGPGAGTVGTPSGVPWLTAVGASQDDGVFGTGLLVTAPAGLAGTKVGLEGSGPVRLADTGDISATVVPAAPADGCGPLSNGGAVNGNIALVIRGTCGFINKYDNAAAAGARAIVVYNDGTSATRMDPIEMGGLDGATIPGIMISYPEGNAIATASGPVTGTVGPSIVISLNNRIAGFSSRGPNNGAPDIIKPDVAAPGVAILAAASPSDDGELFISINGTSMASPHVAGVFALLKQAHPDWTPAMAKSALMTTARQNLKKTFGDSPADPFDIGSGAIVPSAAFDPGLAYDAGLFEYAAFTCGNNAPIFTPGTCDFLGSLGMSFDGSDLNYPSIAVAELAGQQTVTRTVTNVANNEGNKSFTVSVDAPPGINVSVNPRVIKLKRGQSATYTVTLTTAGAALNQWTFGSLTWSHGGEYSVRSPIAVKPVALAAPAEVSGSYDVTFGYTGPFSATPRGLIPATTVTSFVTPTTNGDGYRLYNVPVLAGNTYARFSLFDANTTPGSDLDLQVYRLVGSSLTLIGSSGGPTSEEEINFVNLAAGTYYVAVWYYAAPVESVDFTLFIWRLGSADAGNMVVTAPATASTGGTGAINLSFTGLAPATKYLGSVAYVGAAGMPNPTIVRKDTP